MRKGDMSEEATNKLMQFLSYYPDHDSISLAEERTSFKVTEVHNKGFSIIETRIASVEMSAFMGARMRSLYVTHHPVDMLTQEYLDGFLRAAFLLLYRYSYVDPGYRRQSYLAPQYFSLICKAFNRPSIDLEAFASAFNTTCPSYCSLFPDVEADFGSRGSFFEIQSLKETDYLVQLSPPRISDITKRAVEHAIHLLEQSQSDSQPHYIITLTPASWQDINEILTESEFFIWKNETRSGDKIEYREVIEGHGKLYPMPTVCVLSNKVGTELDAITSQILHSAFSGGDQHKRRR